MLLLNPPGLPREAVRSITIQALARQTVATQELLALTQALSGLPSRLWWSRVRCVEVCTPRRTCGPSSDEDILTRPEDLARAEEVFRQRGYSLQEEGDRGRLCGPGAPPVCGWSCTGASVAI